MTTQSTKINIQPYKQWINDNVDEAYGLCNGISHQMLKAFPELIITNGQYECPIWGRRTHWWLKTIDGQIIDPTAKQFPSKGIGQYREFTDEERQNLPTGICPDCGDDVYKGNTFCSKRCERLYMNYINSI